MPGFGGGHDANNSFVKCSLNIGTGTIPHPGMPITSAGTLANLWVSSETNGGTAESIVVLKNGVATALTCTYAGAKKCSDATHSVSVAAGDLITVENTATTAAGSWLSVAFELQ
jgi:hypothetical protein